MLKNKKAWIKIVEAFFAAVLVIVVVVLVINKNNPTQEDQVTGIYNSETFILRTIQLNNSLRSEVLSADVPVNYDDQANFPREVRNFIDNQTQSSLICEAQICNVADPCTFWSNVQASIYVQDTIISSNFTYYHPVKLKLYCWNRQA